MTPEKMPNRNLLILGLAIFTLAPSFDTALKYFGTAGVVAYFLLGTAFFYAADRFVLPLYKKHVNERRAEIIAFATLTLLITVTLIVYPMANAGQFGGGSDADDALVVAVGELLKGSYPYTPSTYLGNPISPMPGTVLLSIPFVVIGAIHLQNIFWLTAFFFVFRHFERSAASAIGLILVMLTVSPTLLQNIVTGADYASNSIYILVLMWILMRSLSSPAGETWVGVLIAIMLGIGLSSRSTFMLIMPLFLALLVQRAGWKKAITYITISGIAFLMVTLPFWIYDPAGFAPLRAQSDKLKLIENVLPFAGVIIPGLAGSIAVILSFQDLRTDMARFLRNCAIVQLFVLLFTSIVYSIKLGHIDFFLQQSGYGMFTLIFGATAFWMCLYNGSDVADGI